MPGVYAPGDYDLAGFAVGAVERESAAPAQGYRSGRRHPRAALLGRARQRLLPRAPRGRADGTSAGGDPRRSRLARRSVKRCSPRPASMSGRCSTRFAKPRRRQGASPYHRAAVSPTIFRACCPSGLPRRSTSAAFASPAVFTWLSGRRGSIKREMLRTFNCGIGMIVIVSPARCRSACVAPSRQGGETDRRHRRSAGGASAVRYRGTIPGSRAVSEGSASACSSPGRGSNIQVLDRRSRCPRLSRQDRCW